VFDFITKPCNTVSPHERRALVEVLAEAFEMAIAGAEPVMDSYLATVPRVLLAFERDTLAGFHFYDELVVQGLPVFRFSLAVKSSRCGVRGLHRAMGSRLLWQAASRINPFGKIVMAGICNNPRTYKSARSAGGAIFPDVLRPGGPFAYDRLYQQVAQHLGIEGLDPETGLIENRATSVGLVMPHSASAEPRDALYQSFLDYVEGNLNRGVFTMVVVRPIVAALRQGLRRVRKLMASPTGEAS
jgi:hypothetical protein